MCSAFLAQAAMFVLTRTVRFSAWSICQWDPSELGKIRLTQNRKRYKKSPKSSNYVRSWGDFESTASLFAQTFLALLSGATKFDNKKEHKSSEGWQTTARNITVVIFLFLLSPFSLFSTRLQTTIAWLSPMPVKMITFKASRHLGKIAFNFLSKCTINHRQSIHVSLILVYLHLRSLKSSVMFHCRLFPKWQIYYTVNLARSWMMSLSEKEEEASYKI